MNNNHPLCVDNISAGPKLYRLQFQVQRYLRDILRRIVALSTYQCWLFMSPEISSNSYVRADDDMLAQQHEQQRLYIVYVMVV